MDNLGLVCKGSRQNARPTILTQSNYYQTSRSRGAFNLGNNIVRDCPVIVNLRIYQTTSGEINAGAWIHNPSQEIEIKNTVD